ncbi:MAG: hypothetical protein J7604_25520 [Sporocytophaga sp.]|uniref:hypothetical protein n=1 Tax=Sporocytophaga sp. TaxID=2231183 RepID=UPI001B2F4277|nr:hypothetical protein [Sporocytophaga sp.]MBO9703589.1 hypothetical protein [Sporocytophaga sp.]
MNRETWDEIMRDGAYSQELDWLAVDNKGQLGIFTAILNAPIPNNVKLTFENYMDLGRRIESSPKTTSAIVVTSEKGNFADWIGYAEKGFFAYDFQDVHRSDKKNQYDLIARPVRPMKIDDFNLPLLLLGNLVKIDCDFSDGDININKVN